MNRCSRVFRRKNAVCNKEVGSTGYLGFCSKTCYMGAWHGSEKGIANQKRRHLREVQARQANAASRICELPGCEKSMVGRKSNTRFHSLVCRNLWQSSVRYNLPIERYLEMLREGCIGCGAETGLHVDHNHKCCPGQKSCGKCVRGILCNYCNSTLGYAKENPSVLRRLALFVEESLTV